MPSVTERRQVGTTDLTVPLIGFGTATIANLYTDIPEDQAVETIHYALNNGIDFLDTAPLYGAGLAEKRLGIALADVPRDSYVMETKVGRLISSEGEVVKDYSGDGIRRSLEASLERMKIDHVDSLLIHDPDIELGADSHPYIIEETFPALADLRRQGMVKTIGVGVNYWEMLVPLAQNCDFDCFMLASRYTLLEQTSLDALELFQQKNISIFAAGVYNTGILAKGTRGGPVNYGYRPAPPEIIERVRRIEDVCDEFNVPMPAAALQFAAAHPVVASLVMGAKNTRQLQQTIDNLQYDIPAAFWDAVRERGIVDERAPLPQ